MLSLQISPIPLNFESSFAKFMLTKISRYNILMFKVCGEVQECSTNQQRGEREGVIYEQRTIHSIPTTSQSLSSSDQ